MLAYRRASARDAETLRALHTLTFPSDTHEDYSSGLWWIVEDAGEPVAFAGMREARTEPWAIYLSRCGVLPSHRGRGIQRELLKRRLTQAKRHFHVVITTTLNNIPSANNLIRAGFRLYMPVDPWGSDQTLYWRKDFDEPRHQRTQDPGSV